MPTLHHSRDILILRTKGRGGGVLQGFEYQLHFFPGSSRGRFSFPIQVSSGFVLLTMPKVVAELHVPGLAHTGDALLVDCNHNCN